MVGQRFVSALCAGEGTQANNSPAIHGDKQQNERDWVLNEFKTGQSPIMVATDVASRGIGMVSLQLLPPLLPIPMYRLTSCGLDVLCLLRVCATNVRNLVQAPQMCTQFVARRALTVDAA